MLGLNDQFANGTCLCVFVSAEDREEPVTEGLLYRQQESHLCQQMKMATVSQIPSTQEWAAHEPPSCSTHTSTGNVCSPLRGFKTADILSCKDASTCSKVTAIKTFIVLQNAALVNKNMKQHNCYQH